MSKKMSSAQLRCLNKLDFEKWKSGYEIRESMSTLEALQRMEKIDRKSCLGAIFMPRVNIKWRRKPIYGI